MTLGNVHRNNEEFAEAAEAYSKAIALIALPKRRSDWTAFYYRGIAYERTKQWDKAEADFRKALALEPDQPMVLELSRLFDDREEASISTKRWTWCARPSS